MDLSIEPSRFEERGAYTTSSHFAALRYCVKKATRGNWALLNTEWEPFITWLGCRWWGAVSARDIEAFLAGPEIAVGATVIAHYFGHDDGACSIMVKTAEDVTVIFKAVVDDGVFSCTEYLDSEYLEGATMIQQLLGSIRREIGVAYLVAKPNEILTDPRQFTVTRVVEEMRDMIKTFKVGWWGAFKGFSIRDEDEAIDDLDKVTCHDGTPAALVCFMDNRMEGYLFHVVSGRDTAHSVLFNGSGYILAGPHHREEQFFRTIGDLLNYMVTVRKVTFVARPFPTLGEWCRGRMLTMEEEDNLKMDIPPGLREFVQEGRDFMAHKRRPRLPTISQ